MPRKVKDLSPLEIRQIKEVGYNPVGTIPGLYLQVSAGGSRSWILRAVVGGKRREIGLGGFPSVTVADAFAKARQAREKIRAGIDPVAERREALSALKASQAREMTFRQAVDGFLADKAAEWKNDKHAAQWASTLETYAYPVIGDLLVEHVELENVLKVLTPIWRTKTETASRLRGRIERVIDWATARKARSGLNPARWRGHLDTLLPRPSKIAKSKNHPALEYSQIGSFMAALRQRQAPAARMLEFCILTNTRTSETTGADWSEIDMESGVWTIPAIRMKADRDHEVPLSPDAVRILKGLGGPKESGLIFVSASGSEFSENAMTNLLTRMDGEHRWRDAQGRRITTHGFRSTFRDWVGDCTNFHQDVAEHAMSHKISDKAEAAYRRKTALEKRRKLMKHWAHRCAQADDKPANVIALRARAS